MAGETWKTHSTRTRRVERKGRAPRVSDYLSAQEFDFENRRTFALPSGRSIRDVFVQGATLSGGFASRSTQSRRGVSRILTQTQRGEAGGLNPRFPVDGFLSGRLLDLISPNRRGSVVDRFNGLLERNRAARGGLTSPIVSLIGADYGAGGPLGTRLFDPSDADYKNDRPELVFSHEHMQAASIKQEEAPLEPVNWIFDIVGGVKALASGTAKEVIVEVSAFVIGELIEGEFLESGRPDRHPPHETGEGPSNVTDDPVEDARLRDDFSLDPLDAGIPGSVPNPPTEGNPNPDGGIEYTPGDGFDTNFGRGETIQILRLLGGGFSYPTPDGDDDIVLTTLSLSFSGGYWDPNPISEEDDSRLGSLKIAAEHFTDPNPLEFSLSSLLMRVTTSHSM
jgi:hypothetical protein